MKKKNKSPLDNYVRSIAHVNRIVFKEVLDNIENQENNGKDN